MKKSDIILIAVVIIVALVAVFSSKGTIVEEEVNYPLTLAGEVGLHEITYAQYEEKVENGDAFIVVIERTGCSYCTMYMPIVEEVAKEQQIPIYFINTENLTQTEFNDLSNNNSYLKRNSWGTPTTLFMLGNRVLDAIGGYVEKDAVLSFLDGRVVFGE